MRVLVTNASGFLGFHLVRRLSGEGMEVHALAEARDRFAQARRNALPTEGVTVYESLTAPELTARVRPEVVVHLYDVGASIVRAGRALSTFAEVLEAAQNAGVGHVVVESSAAVYGANERLPFGVEQLIERPLGVDGAARRSAELFGQSFAQVSGLPVTALRFFSVYGPWAPPEQVMLTFFRALESDRPVVLHEGGQMRRDFTYVDDVVEALVRALERPPDPIGDTPQFAAHNVGSGTPTPVSQVLTQIEALVGKTAIREERPAPKTALPHSWADVRELQQTYGFRPRTKLKEGIEATWAWWRSEAASVWRA